MRFGRWAAAATAMVLAGQASAGRYIEFQVTGSAIGNPVYQELSYDPRTGASQMGIYTPVYSSVETFAYDTAGGQPIPQTNYLYRQAYVTVPGLSGPYQPGLMEYYPYEVPTSYSVQLSTSTVSSNASIGSDPYVGGPKFSFSFDLNDVQSGSTFAPISFGQSAYAYNINPDTRYNDVFSTPPGQITSVMAFTTDVAPLSLQGLERLTVTILPEPGTWAMLILGVGAIGATMRRQHKRTVSVTFA